MGSLVQTTADEAQGATTACEHCFHSPFRGLRAKVAMSTLDISENTCPLSLRGESVASEPNQRVI